MFSNIFFFLVTLLSTSSAASKVEECGIGDVQVEVVFAVDSHYIIAKQEVVNKGIFMYDVRTFFAELKTSANISAAKVGVYAFGNEIKKMESFGDKPSNQHDWGVVAKKEGKKTVNDALKYMDKWFSKIEKKDEDKEEEKGDKQYVRIGVLISDRTANKTELDDILEDLEGHKVLMYAVGTKKNKKELIKIAGKEDRAFFAEFADDTENPKIDEKFRASLCKGITENKFLLPAIIGVGAIVGIIIAVIIVIIVVYFVQNYAYKKWQLRQIAEAEAAMKNTKDINPMYETPVTTTSPENLGINMSNME